MFELCPPENSTVLKHTAELTHYLAPPWLQTGTHTHTHTHTHWTYFLLNFCIFPQVVSSGKRLNWPIASIKDFLLSTVLCREEVEGADGVEDNFSLRLSSLSVLLFLVTFARRAHAHVHARSSSRRQSSSCGKVGAVHTSVALWVVTWVMRSCLRRLPPLAP